MACDTVPPQPQRTPYLFRVALSAQSGVGRRNVALSASTTGLFHLDILDHGVGTTLTEYDDQGYMEAILRSLALVAEAYLSGEGRIEHKRGLFRGRPAMTITVNGDQWTMGRRASTRPYPEDTSGEVGRN